MTSHSASQEFLNTLAQLESWIVEVGRASGVLSTKIQGLRQELTRAKESFAATDAESKETQLALFEESEVLPTAEQLNIIEPSPEQKRKQALEVLANIFSPDSR